MDVKTINTNKYNILIAEDNEANQALLERMLLNSGHTVTVVSNGQEALDELCLSLYELCIIDIQMPVLDGLETISLFRQRYPRNKLPFIILTADESEETVVKCEQVGAMHLAKPIRSKSLANAINQVFETRQDELAGSGEKIIDISQFDYFNDQAFLDTFIDLFAESCEKLTLSLRESCVNDFDGFKRTVHTIKGLSGNINAEALREITIEAENLSPENYTKNADEYFIKITHELSRARNELQKLSPGKVES